MDNMTYDEQDTATEPKQRLGVTNGERPLPTRDPFAVLDEMRDAFKDVPPEEIEREVANAIQEVREEAREAQERGSTLRRQTPSVA